MPDRRHKNTYTSSISHLCANGAVCVDCVHSNTNWNFEVQIRADVMKQDFFLLDFAFLFLPNLFDTIVGDHIWICLIMYQLHWLNQIFDQSSGLICLIQSDNYFCVLSLYLISAFQNFISSVFKRGHQQ